MRDIKAGLRIGFIILFMLALVGCEGESEVKEIKLAHGLDTSHSVHKAMVFMAERLEKKSGGSVVIDIYPNQQLGTERETLELLQIGSLGITKVSTATLENFVPSLKVFGLPYLFRDREHRFNVLESEIGEGLLNESVEQRLKGLTFYDSGTRNFYSKVPMETPEDLNGLKLRVMESNTAIKMVESLGGSPTPISWGELYSALQQGIVDGAENNLPSFYLSRHYEVCKYYLMDEHTALPDEVLIGTFVWNKLTVEEQQWLKEAAMESSEYQKVLWLEAEQEAMEGIVEAGVQVIVPDKELFREKAKPMYEEFSKDPEMRKRIEAIQAIK